MSQEKSLPPAEAQHTRTERRYEHQSLPDGSFVRYLVLQPASSDTDPLDCTLHIAHLNDIPPFEAISYVWGTPVQDQQITCIGKIIRITSNLSEALRQVRQSDKPRNLWVDAICINQVDPKEQGHQVSLMEDIYRKSNRTIICLGVSDHANASMVKGLVAEVDDMIQNIFKRAGFSWDPNSFPLPDEEESLLSHPGWDSFEVLLQQPWFKRGWVVQEAALGRSALVLWAHSKIDWLKLMRAYIWRTRRALKLPNLEQLWLSDLHVQGFYAQRHREAITFRPKGAADPFTILETLDCARWLRVTDPRDRIYAFMSLLSHRKLFPRLKPNYEVPSINVYQDFACGYLSTNGDLDILHFVHNDETTLECNFPSWIPRWDVRLYSSYLGSLNNYHRSSRRISSRLSSSEVTVSLDQTTLGLRAIIMDTVAFTARGFDKNVTTPGDVASLWQSLSKRQVPFPYSCSPLRAFLEIFRCGVYRGILKEWKILESAYMQLLQHGHCQEEGSNDSAEYFHKLRMEDVHNKSFLVSDRGYYGLAPSVVKEGDICCIIFGTRSPFILRRTDREGYYKLVGSVLILSKDLDYNGYPGALGTDEKSEDWVEWGLEEQNIVLC